jgi:hypothetical protein
MKFGIVCCGGNLMFSQRAKALKRFYVVGIAFLVAWSTVSVFGAVGSNERETYLVSLDEDTSPEVFRTIGTKVLVDYGNGYYLTESTESQALVLNRLGEIVMMKNSRMLDLYPSDVTFDTSGETPITPTRMKDFGWDHETYIVQFVGPYRSEWLDAIENEGGRIGKLVPAFSAVVKMSPSLKSKISELPYVQWVGAYKPFYKISGELLEQEGGVRIVVVTFEDSQRQPVAGKLVELGASVLISYPVGSMVVYTETYLLPWIAAMSEVMEIHPDQMPQPIDIIAAKIHGAYDAWDPVRSGLPSSLTGRSPGPDGIDYTADDIYEVVGIQDTGFDIGDPNSGHPDFFLGPVGDRVIRFIDQTGYSYLDGIQGGTAHGTHVAGDALGNGFCWEYYLGESVSDANWELSQAVGIAPEAMMSFDGIQGFGGGVHANPIYWDDQYSDGAHINSNSYGGPPGPDYGPDSYAADDRINTDNDRLIIFAASNEGPDMNTLSSNTQGKNGLAIGASLNFRPEWFQGDNPNLMAEFSSRGGPLQSLGRLKPDLVAVGTASIAPFSYGEWQYNINTGMGNPQPDFITQVDVYNKDNPTALDGDGIPDYRYMDGTSVAAPHAAGLASLVREYLREIQGISDPYSVNSQLVKALMINGAVRMDEALYDYPGYDQGWGRVDLIESLFPSVPRTNRWEEGTMTTTGIWSPSFGTAVESQNVPLKVTLVWVDNPGKDLFRDLNLKVTSPSGEPYVGNIYGTVGQFDGWSVPNPTQADANPLWDRLNSDGWDDVNNVEQIEVEFPEAGVWQIEVVGMSIPSDTPFALVVGADFGPQDEFKVELDTNHPLMIASAQGGEVIFPFSVTNFGTSYDNFFLDATKPPGIIVDFESTVLFGVRSGERIDTYARISVQLGVQPGLYDITLRGISLGSTNVVDELDLTLSVRSISVVTPIQVTNGTVDELDPSVLTFNDGTTDHIFIASMWLTPLSMRLVSPFFRSLTLLSPTGTTVRTTCGGCAFLAVCTRTESF